MSEVCISVDTVESIHGNLEIDIDRVRRFGLAYSVKWMGKFYTVLPRNTKRMIAPLSIVYARDLAWETDSHFVMSGKIATREMRHEAESQ